MPKQTDASRKSLQIQFLNNCRKELEEHKLLATDEYECAYIANEIRKIDEEIEELRRS